MRIRRPRECYHIVYFRGKFWEVDGGGNLPEGMTKPPFPLLSYFAPGILDQSGWYGGWWEDSPAHITHVYFGTHRRKALRWLRQRTLSSGHRAIVVTHYEIRTKRGTQLVLDMTPPLA